MKRVLSLFVISCLMICSCKSNSGQQPASSDQASSDQTETPTGMAATILSFYKAYCTEFDGESKTDSILSVYCTDELREYVMDCVGEYDFVLNGGIYSEIHTESFRVVKQNEKYIVSFEYTPWPARDEPAKDSVYIMVNKENKISYIIRPQDNYRIPNAYSTISPNSYFFYEYVDLGLSVNWATCNIGSYPDYPEWQGKHFAWGETQTKDDFDKDNRFAARQSYYFDGGITVLEPCDDAASVLWGPEWRMPTKQEFQELMDKCTWEWTKLKDDDWGFKVTGTNGNSIFLPTGGFKVGAQWVGYRDRLYYWTSTCNADDPTDEPCAWEFVSMPERGNNGSQNRYHIITSIFLKRQVGNNIRPVTEKPFIPIEDIALDKKKLELEIGDEYILTASFIPQDASKKTIRWNSGNSAVACVDRNGKVTAVSKGKCTLTAVCGEFKKECQVTVKLTKDYVPIRPEKITTIYEFGKEVDSSLIDGLTDFADSLEMKEIFKTHIGDESNGFDVTLSNFTDEDWETEPGDFCTITIETATGQFQFKNCDWVSHYLFENKYFHCLPVGKSRYLLFLRGFDYGCCPGVLTVLAIDETGARVVYNKECQFDELNREPFSITTEHWYSESVSKYDIKYSTAYNLFVEDGALKIKTVELLRE